MTDGWRPRVTNIDITEEQYAILHKYFHHGLQKIVFGMLVDCVIKELETDAKGFIADVLAKDIQIKELLSKDPSAYADRVKRGS